ncbi:hydrogenase nickel incorporation protein HypB [Paraclostridium bifermentans]|uniref:hydrogenase nickel incorporation protein HypB n=1 Tax=Paraclostridium bifermentans TaxID=1490 RepID=UPI00189C7E87|nr:hydrogenase nickel incorporation protein HypB [Paraclostridium bifermentans]
MQIKVVRQILEWNEDCHKEVQEALMNKNVKMINVMGSPGAGKTTFILNLIEELKSKDLRVGVIEGDIEGTIDAKKIQDAGIPVVQLNTQGACHIEAMSIKNIIEDFNLDELDILIVENIGNLVCPAEFDIGEVLKVALLSVPEGDDKVVKYPLMFSKADALVITKYDMIKYFKFNDDEVREQTLIRNPNSKIFKINSLEKSATKEFTEWLIKKI